MTNRSSPRDVAYCCDRMRHFVTVECPEHPSRLDCPDIVIHRYEAGWTGLVIHDGGDSGYKIGFCPWCGKALPDDE